MPKGCRAKLYTVGDNYVASIVNLNIGEGDQMKYHGTPNAIFRVQRGHDVGKVGVMYPGDAAWRVIKPIFNGTFLVVPMGGFKLFVTKKTGKKIGNQPFPTVIDYCGDPQSAFEALGSL